MTHLSSALITLITGFGLVASSAWAESRDASLSHFKKGLTYGKLADYENALLEFKKSFLADPDRTSPLINAAYCHERIAELAGDDPQKTIYNKKLALALYENVLEMKNAPAEHRERAQSRIPILREGIQRLEEERIREKEERQVDDKTRRTLDVFLRELLHYWKAGEMRVLDKCPNYCR